jgi:hypothetical protein
VAWWRFGLALRAQRRAAVGGVAGGVAVAMEVGGGSQRTGPKDRAERAGFSGSEGETKMGRATKWAESQGGCSINYFFEF